jgi:AraC family transcriptional regulator, transcriptional activator of pobA
LQRTLRMGAVLDLAPDNRHAQTVLHLFATLEAEWRAHALGHAAVGLALLAAIGVQVARLQASGHALHSVGAALGKGLDAGFDKSGAWASRKALRVERFRALVDARFATRAPLAHYARELGITVGQLSRLCREVLGLSAQAVVNARVLHEARRELIYTSASVGHIAQALGFQDEAYFGRFFRKHSGHTPSAFRAHARTAHAMA